MIKSDEKNRRLIDSKLTTVKNNKVLVRYWSLTVRAKVKLPLTCRNILSSSIFFWRDFSNADTAVLWMKEISEPDWNDSINAQLMLVSYW